MKERLVIVIDPQLDFTSKVGSLYVSGAQETVDKIRLYLEDKTKETDIYSTTICVTMDSHRPGHISLPQFWVNEKGEHPYPFTRITLKDVEQGKWRSVFNNDWAIFYLKALEKKGKSHTIWPEHCIIGSTYWNVNTKIFPNSEKSVRSPLAIRYVIKGDNPLTEFFSALKAEVEIEAFPETGLNRELLNWWNTFDEVVLAGFCADYCVKETLRDMRDYCPELMKKLIIAKDLIAPLNEDFDFEEDEFYLKAVKKGAKLCISNQF